MMARIALLGRQTLAVRGQHHALLFFITKRRDQKPGYRFVKLSGCSIGGKRPASTSRTNSASGIALPCIAPHLSARFDHLHRE